MSEEELQALISDIDLMNEDEEGTSLLDTMPDAPDLTKPEYLRAWGTPDAVTVMDKCEHITKFGIHTETTTSFDYRRSVYSLIRNLIPKDADSWMHDHIKQANPGAYNEEQTSKELIALGKQIKGPWTTDEMRRASTVPCAVCELGENTSPINIKGKNYIESEATGFYDLKINKLGIVTSKKPNYNDLYKKWQLINTHVTLSESGMVYTHDAKLWKYQTPNEIRAFTQDYFSPKPIENYRKEFMGFVRSENIKPEDWFQDSTEGYINLQNGVFNINKDELHKHSENFGFRYILPYGYEPTAKCPHFLSFLKDVTCGDQELQDVLVEFMGYALANGPCLAEKALLLFGSGANGKSTFMDMLKAVAGTDNYASLSLTALNKDTKRQMIDGKLFNIGEETNINALKDSEVFKTMVTGGEVDVKKLFVQDYVIKNRCKLILACNELPKSKDRSDGLYRRLALVPFSAKFTEENKNPFIKDDLMKELPGIFNLAVTGFKRLVENRYRFSKSKTMEKAGQEYKMENDNIYSWAMESVTWSGGSGDYSYKHELFDSYKRNCEEDGSFIVPKPIFFKRLKDIFEEHEWVESKKLHPMKSDRVRIVKGLKIRGGYEEELT